MLGIRRAFKKEYEGRKSAVMSLFCEYFVNSYSYIDKQFVHKQQILLLGHEFNFYRGCYGNHISRLPAHFLSSLQKVDL